MPTLPSATSKLFQHILPIRNITVTLRFNAPSRPRFYHQLQLNAMLRYWFDNDEDFQHHFRIDCPESGQSHYKSGDYYRFTLYALNASDALLNTLLKRLQNLPNSAPITDKTAPFRDNLSCYSLHDGFTQQPINQAYEISQYTASNLIQEVALWQKINPIRLRWISPARLLKEKSQRKNLKGEARYCRDSSDTNMALLLSRLHDSFAKFSKQDQGSKPQAHKVSINSQTTYSHIFWLDHHYTDKNSNEHKIGGQSGLIEFQFLTEPDDITWQQLVLGQFTGMGQRSSFGFGRYVLETPDGADTHHRSLPAQSLLMRAMHEDNLKRAWDHIKKNSRGAAQSAKPDFFKQETEQLENIEQLTKNLQRIQTGDYTVPDLQGIEIENPAGGMRALSIPPFNDRVLQRALSQVISPTLEQLFYKRSYGYRPGHSRMNARDAIQSAWRDGYHWVYESDIEDFFNSVSLPRLRERLVALYDKDTAVTAIINWMSAPIRCKGKLLKTPQGLPQGSPLSPLLANLMLDDFDCDLRDAGFKLIRYADDFVVMCKSQTQAEDAHIAAQQSLAEHGFKLNSSKTHIQAMEQGIKYLGYLFVNDMALDISKQSKSTTPTNATPTNATPTKATPTKATPAKATPWLAELQQKNATKLSQQQSQQTPKQWFNNETSMQLGERDKQGAMICVTGVNAIISTRGKHIQIYREQQQLYDMPWASLQALILFGHHHLSTPATHAALQAGIPIHYASGNGLYKGCLWNGQAAYQSYTIWQQQQQRFDEPSQALYAAREIVKSRIIHIKETLRQRQINTSHSGLDTCISKLNQCQNLAELNGQEGYATRIYFQLLQALLPDYCQFTERNRRPPKDPFNALLSLGYTTLYGYTDSILRATGLLPWLGFYHQARGQHAALASDMMEPFRHIVERTALTMLLKKSLKEDDFNYSDGGACLLTDTARRRYLATLTTKFETKIKARGETEPHIIFTHIHRQCQSLLNWVTAAEPFHAWRIR